MLNALWISFIESVVCLALTALVARLVPASSATRAALWLAPAAVALLACGASLAASLGPKATARAKPAPVAMFVARDAPLAAPDTLNNAGGHPSDLTGDPGGSTAGVASIVSSAQRWTQDHAPLIVAIWLGGALIFLCRFALRLVSLARLRQRCRPIAPDAIPTELRALLVRLACRAQLAECDGINTPAVVGLGQPLIVLPGRFHSAIAPADLAFVLAHEHAHLMRRDAVTDILARAIEALFWFNCALPIARRRMTLERERACDELAATWTCGRGAAARALWRTAVSTGMAPSLALGISGAHSQLAARITTLLAPPVARPVSPAVLLAAAAGALVMSAAGAALAAPGSTAAGWGHIEPLASMATARSTQVAVLLKDGSVLLAGGLVSSSENTDVAEVFDPGRRQFQPAAPMHVPRGDAAFARLPNGDVLVAGGWSTGGPTASAEIYDASRRVFRVIASMTGPRASAITAVLPDGRILIAGGESSDQHAVRTAEIFDPAVERFQRTGDLQVARTTAAAAALPDGNILVAGGSDGSQALSSAEVYESSLGRFRLTANMSEQREKTGAAALGDGRVLVAGGARDGSWRQQLASTEVYDPRTGRFTPGPNMNAPRFKLGGQVLALPSGRVLITGGDPHAEVFDPQTGQLAPVPGDLGLARHEGTATLLADGAVLIAGGYGNDVRHTASALLYRPD